MGIVNKYDLSQFPTLRKWALLNHLCKHYTREIRKKMHKNSALKLDATDARLDLELSCVEIIIY